MRTMRGDLALSDRELWQRATDGDREAFGQLFDRHAGAVYTYLFRRTANWSEAEDLTSVVFLLAWRKRAQVRLDRDSALPWLYGVANHAVLTAARSRRRYHRALLRLASNDVATTPSGDHADAVARDVDDERRMSELRRAIARLGRHERETIELCVWSGLDYEAAAVALGVSVGTVKARMHRARRKLAGLLSTNDPPSGTFAPSSHVQSRLGSLDEILT